MACTCHRAVAFEGGLYFCPNCDGHVLETIPQYKLKVDVGDAQSSVPFVLFDYDVYVLLKKSCRELLLETKDPSYGMYPELIDSLIGKELLFKLKVQPNVSPSNSISDTTLEVMSIPKARVRASKQLKNSSIEPITLQFESGAVNGSVSIDFVAIQGCSVPLPTQSTQDELTHVSFADDNDDWLTKNDAKDHGVEVVAGCSSGRGKRIKLKSVKLDH